MFISIPKNPLLTVDLTEEDQARISKYGDLATCDVSLDEGKRLIQVSIQDPSENEDCLVIQTTWETVGGLLLKTIGSRLMSLGKNVKFLDGK